MCGLSHMVERERDRIRDCLCLLLRSIQEIFPYPHHLSCSYFFTS
jgi:hypothetical protein